VRFALALLVVVQHFQNLLPAAQRGVFDRSGFGMIAVAIFFVISGFVVTEANAVFYRGRPRAFLVNRLIRLVPPYLAALCLTVAVHAVLGRLTLWDYPGTGPPITGPRLLAGVFGLLPGLQTLRGGDRFEFIPFTWSLRVEIAFYGVAFAALAAAGWTGRPKTVLCGSVLAGLAASALWLTRDRPGLLSCAPMFLLGVALCLSMRQGGWVRGAFVAVALPLAGLGFASWGQRGHPAAAIQAPLLAVLLLLFIVLAEAQGGRWRRLDRRLGDLSYPLYLTHYAVGIGITGVFAQRGLAMFGVGVCVSIGVAAVMAWLVDDRLVRLRNRVRHVRL
jgi:peptidoglycan/LPS O-acetylase OafA/YrhL